MWLAGSGRGSQPAASASFSRPAGFESPPLRLVTFLLRPKKFNCFWVKDGIFMGTVKIMRKLIKGKDSFYKLDNIFSLLFDLD